MAVDPAGLRDLFDRAISLPPAERAAFLDRMRRENPALHSEIDRLLAAHDSAGSVFDTQLSEDPSEAPEAAIGRGAALARGARLGPYVITAALGAGGMGEVYKARDSRLDRTVAIKILPRELASNPAMRQRFEREARAVAALSHPHICPLFDIGQQDDVDYIVMEYVDGETLASRLARQRLPLEAALTYAIQIAEALDTAHEAGIVHRDLKPGNVMLTKTGAKLLDFGLAKRHQPAITGELTTVHAQPVTRTGVILGTVQYMAPEQLEGKPVDARTDIFALGAVLYEMLTARRAFQGATDASLIGNILHAEPVAPSSIARTAPKELDDVVCRCLAKHPPGRPASAAEVHAQLVEIREHVRARDRTGSLPWRPLTRVRRYLAFAGLGVTVMATALATAWLWGPSSATRSATNPVAEPAPVQRNLTRLTFDEGLQTDPTFSPDGRFIAYASDRSGNFDIWVQPVAGGGNAVQVTRSPAAETQPDWSPDGASIVFHSATDGGGLFTIPALGGIERRLTNFGFRPRFSPDGASVLFVDSVAYEAQRINPHAFVVQTSGGTARRIGDGLWSTLRGFAAIDWHPDGRISVLTVPGGALRADRKSDTVEASMVTLPIEGGRPVVSRITESVREQLGHCISVPESRWSTSGRSLLLVCQSATTRNVWSVDVDASTLTWTGPLRALTAGAEFDYRITLARTGGLAAFTNQRSITRFWQYAINDDSGEIRGRGTPVTPPDFHVRDAAVSADGRMLTYTGRAVGSRQNQVWKSGLGTAHRELVLADARPRLAIGTSADGTTFYTRRDEDGRFRLVVTRASNPVEQVVAESAQLILGFDWNSTSASIIGSASPDGRSPFSVFAWPVSAAPHAEQRMRPVLSDSRFNLWNARSSPNGKWICVSANSDAMGGVSIVGVASAEGDDHRKWLHLTSDTNWSDHPRWSSSGSVLLYVTGYRDLLPNVWAIPFDAETGRATAPAHPVTKFDSPARCVSQDINIGIDVGIGRLVAPVTETTGNIWMLDNVDR